MKERIIELTNLLNEANYQYHTMDDPIMEDHEFDKLFNELLKLEESNPELKQQNSPTERVGGFVLDKFEKVEHQYPMMSLSNMFNYDDLASFIKRVKDAVGNDVSFVSESKIDGLGISLIYEKGQLVQALTRGDGTVGENVTNNIKTIRDIPLQLTEEVDITVRGELIINKPSFEKMNEERIVEGKQPFVNPRNAVAGTIRQLDSSIVAKRNVRSFIYHIASPVDLETQSEVLLYLKKLGFRTNKTHAVCQSLEALIDDIKDIEDSRGDLSYDIDGVVVKVNERKYYDKLGSTSRTPRWASAYKFAPEETSTLLKDITFQVGRSGKITPVAELEPVFLDGSTVSRATLHNEDMIVEKDIRVGDHVILMKAGDIIPYIERVDQTKPRGKDKFKMIETCPACGSVLERESGKSDWFCHNDNCSAKVVNRVIHFASREALDITGLGPKIVERLHQEGYINSLLDVYELKNHREELVKLEGYGEKLIDKLLDSIENSKTQSPDKLLNALGIRGVGLSNARELLKVVPDIREIKNKTMNELEDIPGIASIMARNILEYFNNSDNQKTINSLESMGFSMIHTVKSTTNSNSEFTGKVIVITGSFEKYKRSVLKSELESLGAKVTGSVSSKTDILIVGKNPGSKLTAAQALGVKIISEDELNI